MKVFLWCWLCYFQLKEGARHDVYVFTWQWFIQFILAAIKGELFGRQIVNQGQEANCLCSDWLLKNWLQLFASSWFIHFSCGNSLQHRTRKHSTSVFWDWIKPFFDFRVSNITFFLCLFSTFLSPSEIQIPLGCSAHHKSAASLIFKAALPVW